MDTRPDRGPRLRRSLRPRPRRTGRNTPRGHRRPQGIQLGGCQKRACAEEGQGLQSKGDGVQEAV
ncbi:MAG: hypothetical protein ACK55Z_00240, partial [bacterium]